MLLEWLQSAATRSTRAFRDLGYVREVIAIDARRRRCWDSWADHLSRRRAAVVTGIAHAAGRRTAMVLGSGLLLDVPLVELAAAFRRVVLVDVVHPPWVRWRARRFSNVDLIAADVTGTAAALHRLAPGSPLPSPAPFAPLAASDIDYVVSLNLLSQLGVVPSEWIEARWGPGAAATAEAFATAVTRAHLDTLAASRAAVCLIGDVEIWNGSPDGAVVDRRSSIFDAPPPPAAAEWIWNIAPAPESDPILSEFRRVIVSYDPGKTPPVTPPDRVPLPAPSGS